MVFLSLTRLLFFSKTRRMLHILRIITFVFTIKFKTPTTNDVDKFKFCILTVANNASQLAMHVFLFR